MKYALHYYEYGMEHVNYSNNKSILIGIARKHSEAATVCCTADGYILYENKKQKRLNEAYYKGV